MGCLINCLITLNSVFKLPQTSDKQEHYSWFFFCPRLSFKCSTVFLGRSLSLLCLRETKLMLLLRWIQTFIVTEIQNRANNDSCPCCNTNYHSYILNNNSKRSIRVFPSRSSRVKILDISDLIAQTKHRWEIRHFLLFQYKLVRNTEHYHRVCIFASHVTHPGDAWSNYKICRNPQKENTRDNSRAKKKKKSPTFILHFSERVRGCCLSSTCLPIVSPSRFTQLVPCAPGCCIQRNQSDKKRV